MTSAAIAATMLIPRRAHAMAMVMQEENTGAANVPMEQSAYRQVSLTAKANAQPSMTDAQRDDLEHRIKCQCGCILDIYTCRTTDFSCSVSPAMHGDVVELVSKGYNAAEILAAFQGVYGEQVLMAPVKKGFNLVGYAMPFAALGGAAVIVAGLIRRWGQRAALTPPPASVSGVDATPAEMEALNAALRDDS